MILFDFAEILTWWSWSIKELIFLLLMCGYPGHRGFPSFFSAWESCERATKRWTRVATHLRCFAKKKKSRKTSGTRVMCGSHQRESDISLRSLGFWRDFVQRVSPTWLCNKSLLFTRARKIPELWLFNFPAKMSRSNVIPANFSISKGYFRSS